MHSSEQSSGWHDQITDATASVLADVVMDGLKQAIAERVTDYLGRAGIFSLRIRSWNATMCRQLAAAAKAVLALREAAHRATAVVSSRMLPPETPRFYRKLAEKVAEKVPLPWDSHLAAVARGLQVIGIYECIIKGLPATSCACLQMMGSELLSDSINERVQELLEITSRDLQQS